MIRVAAITKRDFPCMSRVLWDFEQCFGPTERRCLTEAGKQYGDPSAGEYVIPTLEQRKK